MCKEKRLSSQKFLMVQSLILICMLYLRGGLDMVSVKFNVQANSASKKATKVAPGACCCCCFRISFKF